MKITELVEQAKKDAHENWLREVKSMKLENLVEEGKEAAVEDIRDFPSTTVND